MLANKEYKESGVVWLGLVPKCWNVQRLKNVLVDRNEANEPVKTDFILSLTNDRGVIPYSEKGDVGNKSKDDVTGYKLAYPGDIVLNSMNVIIGSVGLSNYFGAVSPVYYMLYPRNKADEVKYYNYIFQTREFQQSLKGYGNGIMEIRMRIPIGNLNNVMLPVPTPAEQKAIADYLDGECARIDGIVTTQRQIIERLKEYKKSVITEAVTRGLNPDAPMKDSGIEWIGKIPEHWKVCRLKNYATICNGADYKEHLSEEGQYPIMGSGGAFAKSDAFMYDKDSVLLGRKGTVDKPIFIQEPFWTIDTMYYTQIKKTCIAKFFFYLCTTINFGFYQYGTALPSMTQRDLNSVLFTCPPLSEQQTIADYLDRKCSEIDSIIEKRERMIELMTEYKKSLIYECVTGKKEIVDVVE
jgi:type I restriction enzyme S subunit